MRPALNNSRIAVTGLIVGVALAISVRPTSVVSQALGVRLAMVNVPEDVLRPLLPDFQKQTGRSAEIVYTGNDPFALAREGHESMRHDFRAPAFGAAFIGSTHSVAFSGMTAEP